MIIVTHVISSLERGGAQEVLCSLIEQLDPQQFTSYVIYFHDGPHVQRLKNTGIQTYHIKGFFCQYDPLFWYRFIRFFFTHTVDTIHALLWAGQIASRVVGYVMRIPVVTVYHNQASMESGTRLFFDKVTLRLATNIIAVSNTVADSITTCHPCIPASKITTIANGIDTDTLAASTPLEKASLCIPEHAKIIGTVGRLHPVKKHTLLLQAYALLCDAHPDIYLLFIGDGPEQERLGALARSLKLADRVLFIGNKQAYPYYHLFDCFILASAQEGMSLALLEALYFKRACVVAHPTLTHDVITHDYNGLLVPPDNTPALAQAISSVLVNDTLKNRLGNNAHEKIKQQYGLGTMVKSYGNIFKNGVLY